MKRYMKTVLDVDILLDIKSLTRDGIGGFTVDTVSAAKVGYNDPLLYTSRAVSIISGSTETNTLITNDGLVAVLRAAETLEIIDIFEDETTTYQEIMPTGYTELSAYNEIINPASTRILPIDVIAGGILQYTNQLQFIAETEYHFSSEMTYGLTTDDYGFYITDFTDWANDYATSTQFSIVKKQFIKIETPLTITNVVLSIINIDEGIEIENKNNGIYELKYLDINATEFLELTITVSDIIGTHGYIKIY